MTKVLKVLRLSIIFNTIRVRLIIQLLPFCSSRNLVLIQNSNTDYIWEFWNSDRKTKPDGTYRTRKWNEQSKYKSESKYGLPAVFDNRCTIFMSRMTVILCSEWHLAFLKIVEVVPKNMIKNMEYSFTGKYALFDCFHCLSIR